MQRKHEKKNLNRQDIVAIQGKELKKKYADEAFTLPFQSRVHIVLAWPCRRCTSK